MTMTTINPPPQHPGCEMPTIGCSMCLNVDRRTDATVIVAGYALCDRHADQLADAPIRDIVATIKTLKNPSRSAT